MSRIIICDTLTYTFKVIQPWLALQHLQFWIDFFPYLAQIITNIKRVCHVQWPLTSTYIFKVIQPWFCNKTVKIWHILPCPLYSIYSSAWILSLFGTNDHQHERVCHAMTFDLDLYFQGYLAVTLRISWIMFICCTNRTHQGTMCHISFLGRRSRSHRSFEFLQSGWGVS